MKFECLALPLHTALGQVSKARSKSSLNPLLQCVYLEIDEFHLILRSTNLEIVCEKTISVKGKQNGSCLINADTLMKVISLLNNKANTVLSFEIVDTVFVITNDKDVLKINLFNEKEFPKLPQKGKNITVIEKNKITTLIRDVSFSSATTDIKPDIASVFIYLKEEVLHAVATDSYRLAESKIAFEGDDFSFLIPQKYISDILSILDYEESDLEINLTENLLTFSTETFTLSVTLILGQFPDYKQLFPKEFTTLVKLKKEDLQKTLTLSSFFTETYNTTNIVIMGKELIVSSKNDHIGSMTKTLQIEKSGDDIENSYNNKYFLEVFSHLEGDEIILSFTTKNRPLFITSNRSNSYTYLLMPINR
jgi:DNA polymerase-3 subunit beta